MAVQAATGTDRTLHGALVSPAVVAAVPPERILPLELGSPDRAMPAEREILAIITVTLAAAVAGPDLPAMWPLYRETMSTLQVAVRGLNATLPAFRRSMQAAVVLVRTNWAEKPDRRGRVAAALAEPVAASLAVSLRRQRRAWTVQDPAAAADAAMIQISTGAATAATAL